MSYGNGGLWVELYPGGIVRPAYYGGVRPDGSIAIKFPWTRGVTGSLTITGRRVDDEASPLDVRVATGYGRTGFQSTALTFPTAGCWEVTGRAGDTTLTFVTKVVGPRPPCSATHCRRAS